jgi:ABC-type uncharacterized transport system permease subunit
MTVFDRTVVPSERLTALREHLTWAFARHLAARTVFWGGMYLSALVVFGAFTALHHANPFSMYHGMWEATVMNAYGRGQVLDMAAPFILTGLAVAVPARAGLVNIGGEGQIVIGVTAAGGVALALGTHVTGTPALILMGLGAAVAGAAWAAIATVLRLVGNVNEAIATLLLNYVGADVLNYLVYGPWRDPAGNGQPAARPMPLSDTLPSLGSYAHIGIIIALVAAVGVAFALKRTSWGFMLRCVGGNQVAARRAGLKVAWLMFSAMLVGGALAGLAGMIQFTGLEGQLRPGIAATYGYTGFLASWLARHQPGKVVLAATLLAGIAVAGDSLQITTHLPGSTVNILMAVILLAILATRGRSRAAA